MALNSINSSDIPNIDDEDSDIEIIEIPGNYAFNLSSSWEIKEEENSTESESTPIICTSPIVKTNEPRRPNYLNTITNDSNVITCHLDRTASHLDRTNSDINRTTSDLDKTTCNLSTYTIDSTTTRLINPHIEKEVSVTDRKISKKSLPFKTKPKSKEKKIQIKKKFKPDSIQSIRDQLKGIIFSGWVYEREYLDFLKAYRDKIEVDDWENNLIQNLKAISHNISGVREGNKWISITDNSPCYCIWVLLDSAPYPGHYWLQIKDVVLDDKYGLQLTIDTVRKLHPFDGETHEQRERRIRGDISTDEWKEWLLSIGDMDVKTISSNALSVLTPSSISKGFRLTVMLLVTLVVGLCTLLKESSHFILLFLREFGILVHRATPFLQSVIQFGEKTVGGFYLLISMIFRDIRKPNIHRGPPHMMEVQRQRAISHSGGVGNPPPTYVAPEAWVFKND